MLSDSGAASRSSEFSVECDTTDRTRISVPQRVRRVWLLKFFRSATEPSDSGNLERCQPVNFSRPTLQDEVSRFKSMKNMLLLVSELWKIETNRAA